jgi:hypothetical protein
VAETVEGFEKLAATPTTSLVTPFSEEVFYEEPPVMRLRGELRHVKLIINFTPTNLAMAGLSAYDLKSVVSMARVIAREPEFGLFSVVAYQSQRELIFFEQNRATQIEFPALGEALADVRGGTVDIETLQDKESSRRFLLELLEQNLIHGESDPDAIIFLGPKLVFDCSAKTAVISPVEITSSPIFYLIYNRNPRVYPWRDAISLGLSNQVIDEFNILEAKDFGEAVRSILARLEASETLTAVEQETTIP